jgi:hypothetical protein
VWRSQEADQILLRGHDRDLEAQRVEKVLEDAGVKLAAVATSTLGVSARAMPDALVAGERDPRRLLSWLRKGCGLSCPSCAWH